MTDIISLDPFQSVPASLKEIYKYYQKLPGHLLDTDTRVVDFERGLTQEQIFLGDTSEAFFVSNQAGSREAKVHESKHLPGLHIVPSLVSQKDQWKLMSSLFHGNLANPRHNTNVHLHHRVPYHALCRNATAADKDGLRSFFHLSPDSAELFPPKSDEHNHKAFTVSQFLTKKLRWFTLGGQYDWTAKTYAGDEPPFPTEICDFIHKLFPLMTPQAAIVNLYKAGDVLGMHRDVSEYCDNGLVSISLGCDGIFIAGLQSESDASPRYIVLRLHSGDAIYMSGSARFAWHGVARVLPSTCPSWLSDWPAQPKDNPNVHPEFEAWRGWMSNKRVNLNARQIRNQT